MTWILCISLVFFGLFGLINLVYLFVLVKPGQNREELSVIPMVSILVAARNEQTNILHCLQALDQLGYPKDRLEIFIGDDASEDDTLAMANQWAATRPHFKIVAISDRLPGLQGKQNVLAQLSQLAQGEFLFVTDADMEVPTTWVSSLLSAFRPRTGMVCGATMARKGVQALDWMMGLALQRAHAVLGIPVTALGNNMAIRRTAYESVGGYAGLSFSIVEDYHLFHHLCEKGDWDFAQVLKQEALVFSEALPGLGAWVQQRKRWFSGALGLAWYNLALMTFNALVVPVLILTVCTLQIQWWLPLLSLKIGFDFALLAIGAAKLGRLKNLWWFPVYELYYWGVTLLTPVLVAWPMKIRWKGRVYDAKGKIVNP